MAGKKASGKRIGAGSRSKRSPPVGSSPAIDRRARKIVRELVIEKLNEQRGRSDKRSGEQRNR